MAFLLLFLPLQVETGNCPLCRLAEGTKSRSASVFTIVSRTEAHSKYYLLPAPLFCHFCDLTCVTVHLKVNNDSTPMYTQLWGPNELVHARHRRLCKLTYPYKGHFQGVTPSKPNLCCPRNPVKHAELNLQSKEVPVRGREAKGPACSGHKVPA